MKNKHREKILCAILSILLAASIFIGMLTEYEMNVLADYRMEDEQLEEIEGNANAVSAEADISYAMASTPLYDRCMRDFRSILENYQSSNMFLPDLPYMTLTYMVLQLGKASQNCLLQNLPHM